MDRNEAQREEGGNVVNKRRIYKVRWDKDEQEWFMLHPDGGRSGFSRKPQAVEFGAECARGEWKFTGTLTQLRVYNKNGRIAFERTYGKDPKRRKG
jgi:hypothetical protein